MNSLAEYSSSDDEDTVTDKSTQKRSSLSSILPPPKLAGDNSINNITSKNAQQQKRKQFFVVVDETEKEIQEEDNTNSKKIKINQETVKSTGLFSLLPKPKAVSKKTLQESPKTTHFIPNTIKKSSLPIKKEVDKVEDFFSFGEAEAVPEDNEPIQGPVYKPLTSASSLYTPDAYYSNQPQAPNDDFDDEKQNVIESVAGRKKNEIQYVEIKQSEIVGRWDEEKHKVSLTQQELARAHLATLKPVTKSQKKNHTIFSLAREAAINQAELLEAAAIRRQNVKITKAKYGW
ncbi:hypothetical protein HK099_004061 [Clydaea vesicula]|uniref:Uncharacterized protein n=1 Tax=Clydaea vesicula TaxID=447962 RepID=A0AAD5Y0H4_9FUNG|nr:hypothetical protein HK099_004061 [Clydaea vesicula]